MASSRLVFFASMLCLISASPTTTSLEPTTTYVPPPVPNVGQWGQCGGIGWTGGTICPTYWVCTYSNDFHSQCLPGPDWVWPSTTSTAPTTTVTYPPQQTFNYIFSFGDNFTDTGFDLGGAKPAVGNQLGNPPFPGLTTSGGPNWVGNILIDNPNLVAYNFATRGATIDASLIAPKDATAKSLVDQISEFTSNLVPSPEYAPWNTNNTFFVIWMGNTDITLAYNQPDWSTLCGQLLDKYFEQVEILYNAGARSFMFLEIPQLESTPAMLLEPAENQQAIAAAIDDFNNLLISKTNTFMSDKGFYSQFPSPVGFAQVIGPPIALWFLLNNPTAYGAPNAWCYNPDGVSCIWTDEYNPGEVFQELVSVYVAEVVGIPDYQ